MSICNFYQCCICVFVFVYLQGRHMGTLFFRFLHHHLSENIWFVWSKTSYSGGKRRCYQAGQTTNERQTTMEDSATQPLGCWKAEFRNDVFFKVSMQNHSRTSKTCFTLGEDIQTRITFQFGHCSNLGGFILA